MNAIISAQRGVALLLDDEQLHAVITSDAQTEKKASLEFVAAWLRGAEELVFLEDTDADQVQHRLCREVNRERAFQLFLPLFDVDLPADVREVVGEDLECLFFKNNLLLHVTAARFYGAPFPQPEQLDNALSLAADRPWPLLHELLTELKDRQLLIREVCLQWAAIPPDKFDRTLPQNQIHELFVRAGLFYRLVDAFFCNVPLARFVEDEESNRHVNHIPNLGFVLRQWTKPFWQKQSERLAETFAEVEICKASILAHVQRGNIVAVESEARALIVYQMTRGAAKYPAMSLCDLAIRSKELGAFREQELLAHLAVETNSHDPQCWTQWADGMKNCARSKEALAAYDEVIAAHPENAVAKNGRAEVLRDLGKPQEALAAYEQAIAAHPDNAVAKAGRAEVLRDMGKPQEALAAYDEVIAAHPENAVAKNGRAEVLRDLGKPQEALAAYEQAIAAHPDNAVAKAGRAEVLRDMGKPQEALAAYDEVIAAHSNNAVAKAGRAEVLRDMGKPREALAAYEEVIAAHPENAVAKNGRAEVLRDMSKSQEALAAYEETIAAHPNDIVAKNGRAEVLRDMGKPREALAAYEETIAAHPNDIVAKAGRAEVLRDMGKPQEALAAYNEVIAAHPNDVVAKTGCANLLSKLGHFDEALNLLPDEPVQSITNWIGFHVRGMIYMRQGRLTEAQRVFRLGCESELPIIYRDYFRLAFAISQLRLGKIDEALENIAAVKSRKVARTKAVIYAHALGEKGAAEECGHEIARIHTFSLVAYDIVAEEIAARFVKHKPQHDEVWLIEKEEDLLLAA